MPQHIYYLDRSLLLGKYVYINAYEVFLAVLILSSVTNFEEYYELQSRTITRCVTLSSVVKTGNTYIKGH
jgi:hypothetical protein